MVPPKSGHVWSAKALDIDFSAFAQVDFGKPK
jgi:hypothetical protein